MIIMETGLEETDRYNDNGCDKSLTELPRSGIAQVTSSQLQFMILVLQVYNSSDISYHIDNKELQTAALLGYLHKG